MTKMDLIPFGRAVFFTKHALDRMSQRGVTPNEVFGVLKDNQLIACSTEKLVQKRGGCMLIVAANFNPHRIIVMTVAVREAQ